MTENYGTDFVRRNRLMTKCRYLENDVCQIVKHRTGVDFKPAKAACDDCAKQIPPQRWNKVTLGLSWAALRKTDEAKYKQKLEEWMPLFKEMSRHAKAATPKPGIVATGKRYVTAVARWMAAGSPVREDSEVDRIFAICLGCEHYNGKSCQVCSCRVNKSQTALLNKIRMATEKCPKEKWT